LAWAGYNAGPGKILKAQQKGLTDFWSMAKGKTLRRETQGYVPKLMACAIIAKHPEAFGFRPDEIEPQEWTEYELVTIRGASDIGAIARAAQVPEQAVLDLNPELRHSCTPPRAYQLKLPSGTAGVFAENWPKIEKSAALGFARHRVRKGDTMGAIAAAYGVPVPVILKLNGLRSAKRIRPGTDVMVPLTGRARRDAPATEVAARTRIKEVQQRNPELAARPDPPRRKVERISKEPSGRLKASVMVQEGDSLWLIAQRYGVQVAEICRWNGISNPRRQKLQIGREIIVYPRTAGGSAATSAPDAS
jgi:membrane-bound lytic murein transglycosylase D